MVSAKRQGFPNSGSTIVRVQAITKLLSNPAVSPQVSREIAGHISQTMQSHYTIQQYDTKMAALEALEHPAGRTETEPTPPAQQPASAGLIQPAIQAEIDRLRAEIARLANRQSDWPYGITLQRRAPLRRMSARKGERKGLTPTQLFAAPNQLRT